MAWRCCSGGRGIAGTGWGLGPAPRWPSPHAGGRRGAVGAGPHCKPQRRRGGGSACSHAGHARSPRRWRQAKAHGITPWKPGVRYGGEKCSAEGLPRSRAAGFEELAADSPEQSVRLSRGCFGERTKLRREAGPDPHRFREENPSSQVLYRVDFPLWFQEPLILNLGSDAIIKIVQESHFWFLLYWFQNSKPNL